VPQDRGFSGNDKRAEGIPKLLDFGFGDFLLPRFVFLIQHCPLLSFRPAFVATT
jgi:hypothetical protein